MGLSLEILWRNAIISYANQCANQEKYSKYIDAGFPFEILDGDNSFIQYEFLLETFKQLAQKKILVISVIGPENSGKSTLLNFLFGTTFDVRAGRCTRGIYGSFVKTNRDDFEFILLIDTEGIFSSHRKDEEFNRRIVLFCLAVSHLILVNVVDQLHSPLESILHLCINSLSKMGVSRIPKPVVHIVLNQKANFVPGQPVPITGDLISNLENPNLIELNANTIHQLPSAFQRMSSRDNSFAYRKTASDFIVCIDSLLKKLLNSAENVITRGKEFLNPVHWISSANTVFDTLQKFPDLTFYRDIHERHLDKKIRQYIRDELTKRFSNESRERLIEEFSKLNQNEILPEQIQIQDETTKELEKLLLTFQAPEPLRKRSKEFLQFQISGMFKAFRSAATARKNRERVKTIFQTKNADLKEELNRIVSLKNEDEASAKFEDIWTEMNKKISLEFNETEVFAESKDHIYANYNIYETNALLPFSKIDFGQFQPNVVEMKKQLSRNFARLSYNEVTVITDYFNPNDRLTLETVDNIVHLNKNRLATHSSDPNPTTNSDESFQIKKLIISEREKFHESDDEFYFPISKLFDHLIDSLFNELVPKNAEQPRQIRTELVQKIAGFIDSLLINVNNELAPFSLSLSLPLKAKFHSCAVIVLTNFYFKQQK